MSADKITSLSGFIDRVGKLRKDWEQPAHKELWFRGESERYETCLRPELYRPKRNTKLKPIGDLLKIETDLYNDFDRRAIQLAAEEKSEEYWRERVGHLSRPRRLGSRDEAALGGQKIRTP